MQIQWTKHINFIILLLLYKLNKNTLLHGNYLLKKLTKIYIF